MKFSLLLVVFLAFILEVESLEDQEQDSRHIQRKVSLFSLTKKSAKIYFSGKANKGKIENWSQYAKKSSNINGEAINMKMTD